jgi:hypothetical protein
MRDYEATKKSEGNHTTQKAQPIIDNLASAGSDLPSDHYTGSPHETHSMSYAAHLDMLTDTSLLQTSTNVETWAPSEPASAADPIPYPSQEDCQILLNMYQDSFPLPDATLLF